MPGRSRLTWFVVAFWTFFAVFGAVQTYVSMLTHGHSLARMLFFQLAVWSVWVPISVLVDRLGRAFPVIPPRFRTIAIHVLAAPVVAAIHVAIWIELTILIQPYDDMTISEFGPAYPMAMLARVPLELLLYLLVLGGSYAIDFYAKLRDREISLAQARLHALELQIQPHFLFNTLHAIGSLVRNRRQDEAVEMIAGLSDLLRYSLDHAGTQRVPLEKEQEMLERYLGIQRVRFADRLTFTIDIPPELRRARVLTLILQPLAENAIRHGIAQSAGAGRVEVRAAREDGMLRIEMFNSGVLPPNAPKGLGLRNTEDRLRQLYGDAQRFTLRNVEGGVLATIAVPWSES